MNTRMRIIAVSVIAIAYSLWLPYLTGVLSEPKLLDGVTFERFHSARESIGNQVGKQFPNGVASVENWHDSPIDVKITGNEVAGIVMIEDSMQDRIDMIRARKTILFWNALAATTLLVLISISGLIFCRCPAEPTSDKTPTD